MNDHQWDWVVDDDLGDPGPGERPGLGADPRVQAGLEHLQRAAREAIAASRALLDVAEELVEDPKVVGEVFQALGSLGGFAGRANRPGSSGRPSAARPTDGEVGGDDGGDSPVQRIPIS